MPKTNPKRVARERFRKRKANCIKKIHELGSLCQAEVYTLIHRNGKYYTYTSTNRPHWPPPESEINNHYPLPERKYPSDFEAQTDGSTKDSDTTEEKDLIEDVGPRGSTQSELIGGHKEIGTRQRSQQLTWVSMPPLLQLSPVEERSSVQHSG